MERLKSERSPPRPGSNQSVSVSARGRDFFFPLLWIPYALLVHRFWFVTDDAFISFRFAKNWAQGHGPRFNLGDQVPVDGYSNFLWVAVNAVVEYLGGNILFWPLVISFACGSLLLYLVFITLRRRLNLSARTAFLATLLLSCSPPFAVWSTSGLATMPFSLLLFLAFERLILRKEGIGVITGAAAGLALSLIRVEGVYWALLLGPLAVVSRRLASQKVLRPLLIYLGLVLAGYAIYLAWHYSYYQTFLSNTFYVKVFLSKAVLVRGLNYVIHQHLTFLPLFLAVPGFLSALRRDRRPVGIPVILMWAGMVSYAVVVGGDFMAMARFLVPGLPFTVILTGWLLADLRAKVKSRLDPFSAIAMILVGVGLFPAWNNHLVPFLVRQKYRFRYDIPVYYSEYDQWMSQKRNVQTWSIIGQALQSYARSSDTIVLAPIGAIGYYSGIYVHDTCGLTNREFASRKAPDQLKSPGHDKCVAEAYFLGKKPDLLDPTLYPESLVPSAIKARRRGELAQEYIGDFAPAPGFNEESLYLVIMRRIPDGADREQAWEEAIRRLQTLPGHR